MIPFLASLMGLMSSPGHSLAGAMLSDDRSAHSFKSAHDISPDSSSARGSLSVWVITVAGLLMLGLLVLFAIDRMFHPEKFQIEEVSVRGEFNFVDADKVDEVINGYLKGNYFSVSLERLEQQVEKLPWVFSASLRRVWPATLQVEIVEIQPLARWGDDKWVNFTGDLVERHEGLDESGLPVIDGKAKDREMIWKHFNLWSDRFSAHGLRLRELRLSDARIWSLGISLGVLAANDANDDEGLAQMLQDHMVTVIVEQHLADDKIERLIDVLKHEPTWTFGAFGSIESIDLRYPNGFAVGRLDRPLIETGSGAQ